MNSGDEDKFADLYARYGRQVAAYCRRRTDFDEVDDVTADVFLTVWRKIGEAPDGDETLRWLYRIAYLVLSNHRRRNGRRNSLDSRLRAIAPVSTTPLQEQVVMRHELREVLVAAARLRPRDQEILRLSLWEHLSHEDIGVVLGIEPNAVKQRLHRARKALAREHERMTKKPSRTPAARSGGGW